MWTSGPPALILHGGDETNTIHIPFGNHSCGATLPVVQSTHVVRLSLNVDDHTSSGRVGVMYAYPASTTLVQSARDEGYQGYLRNFAPP